MNAAGYLVLDLETIALDVWTAANPEVFPPPWACRIIVIGWCYLGADLVYVGHGTIEEPTSERAMIYKLGQIVGRAWERDRQAPTLVTYNGRGFDLSVLRARSLVHEAATPWLYGREVEKRYTDEGHLDLADAIAGHGASRTAKLDDLTKAFGRPGKGSIDGADVARIYAAGGISEISRYCLGDVADTAHLLMRYKFTRGAIPYPAYKTATAALDAAFQDHAP